MKSECGEALGDAKVSRLGLHGGGERATVQQQRLLVFSREPALIASEQESAFVLNEVGTTHKANQRVAYAILYLCPKAGRALMSTLSMLQ